MNDLIEQLNGILPARTVTYVILAWVLMQAIGRAYHAVAYHGGGLMTMWRALIFGTNTPHVDEPAPDGPPKEKTV